MQKIILLFGFVLLVMSGCAPVKVENQNAVFFPPEPDPPRVQYLMGIRDSRDVVGEDVETSLFSLNETVSNEVKVFVKPYGIATSGQTIYVSDTLQSQIAVINLAQKSFTWLKGNFGPGKLQKPTSLATDRQGFLYVADTVRKKVMTYDAEGNFVRTYGDGRNIMPVGVGADDRRVYALDRNSRKILVFNKKTGRLIEALGQTGNPAEGLALPTNMALTERGVFYVADAGRGSIVSLDRDGHILGAFGKLGDGFGQFGRPKGIAVGEEGRLFVVDAAHQNIQIFNPEGRLLMFFGSPGLPVGSLNVPAGLAVTGEGLDYFQQFAEPDFELEQIIMAVNQVDTVRIAIYGLGHKRNFDYEKYYRDLHEKRVKEAESFDDEQKKKSSAN